MFARQCERLVVAIRVDRLGAAADGGERLNGNTHDVVVRLLRRQRRAPGLRMEAEGPRLGIRRAETLTHDACPQPARGPELRHLLEEVVVRVEEEGEALA